MNDLIKPWRGPSDHLTPSGALLVCHWPSEGAYAYLHELYPPGTRADSELVQRQFEFQLPRSYLSLLRKHNGARFFLGAVSVSGVVANLVRSPHPDQAQPGLLFDGLEIFRAMFPERWDAGWRRIGGVTVNQQWSIELNQRGAVTVVQDGKGGPVFSDIWQCLARMMQLLTPSFHSEGTQVDSWDDIDKRLELGLS